MLSFEEKLAIMQSFPELQRKDVSLGRVNFHYDASLTDKKNVGYHFHPNGNGYVYAVGLDGVETDGKGFANVRDYDEPQLRELVARSIRLLGGSASSGKSDSGTAGTLDAEAESEKWRNEDGDELSLQFEDDMWYLFAGLNLEMAFETREEAEEYLADEGFVIAGN
ncbi:hypothetical protein J4772_34220 [Cohnella sp. LGH]|uniref:hypothetical protein n=1 Tax=Cohnella sp. LGH TaxID=1619153 RepID=UPI001ADC3E08|nr:hypothetical protein [Cohnella sp. LGH]QTH42461.1 hypothetical protein J4772_34220 [Cohnella sp. LGH]